MKVDIFHAYIALLKQTRPNVGSIENDVDMDSANPVSLLQTQVRDIVKALHKQLREKSIKTRQGSFALLTELIHVLPGCLNLDAATLIPGILYSLRLVDVYLRNASTKIFSFVSAIRTQART